MNFKKRSLIFVTFFSSCLAISLLGAALGTEHWLEASCVRQGDFSDKSNGTVNFGLFRGSRHLNSGLGDRHYPMNMLQILFRERAFMIYELYIATIALLCSGILFGVLSALLAIVNTAYNPSEAICHIPGLYLTNGLGCISGLAAFVTWMVQFYVKLTHNALIREDREKGKWNSGGMAVFGYSFWLTVLATLAFIINILIIIFTTRNPREMKKKQEIMRLSGKQAGDTMLY